MGVIRAWTWTEDEGFHPGKNLPAKTLRLWVQGAAPKGFRICTLEEAWEEAGKAAGPVLIGGYREKSAPWNHRDLGGFSALSYSGLLAQIWMERNHYGPEVFQLVSRKNLKHFEAFRGLPETQAGPEEFFATPPLSGPLRESDLAKDAIGGAALLLEPGGPALQVHTADLTAPRERIRNKGHALCAFPELAQARRAMKAKGELKEYGLLMLEDRAGIWELLCLEALGFVPEGKAGADLMVGAFGNKKPPPVNPDGGALGGGWLGTLEPLRQAVNAWQLLKEGETALCVAFSESFSRVTLAILKKAP